MVRLTLHAPSFELDLVRVRVRVRVSARIRVSVRVRVRGRGRVRVRVRGRVRVRVRVRVRQGHHAPVRVTELELHRLGHRVGPHLELVERGASCAQRPHGR